MDWKKFKKQKLEKLEKPIEEKKVDEDIIPLVNILNKHENIVTTSSCYGRIVLLEYDLREGKKESNFYRKWHRKIKSDEVEDAVKQFDSNKQLWFKVEPFILHISTKDIESAKWFLEKIRLCGIKRGGIQTISKKVTIEVQGHGQMIFPVEEVKAEWKKLIKIANDMMNKNATAIKKIEKAFKS